MSYKFFNTVILCAALLTATPAQASNKYLHAKHSTVLVETDHGLGSGFVMRYGNRIVIWTAAHVVREVTEVRVRKDNKEFSTEILAVDPDLDLAVLVVSSPGKLSDWETVKFSRRAPQIGDRIFHIGNLFGTEFPLSLTSGVISQFGVSPGLEDWPWKDVDQTDATFLPGSSGGPVFDKSGKVIGVSVGHVDAGINIFVPLRAIKKFADRYHLK